MPPARDSFQRACVDGVVLVLAFGLSALYVSATARRIGPTFDETTYVAEGLKRWESGSHGGLLRLGTMPLPVDVVTLAPALVARTAGGRLNVGEDLDALLPLARTGTLVFWALLLAYGLFLGSRLAGAWAGRLAVALLAAEPCLVAHASLSTTDIAISAALLALVHSFGAARRAPWGRRVMVPGLWAGVALLSKASAMVFGPVALLGAELVRTGVSSVGGSQASGWRARSSPFLRDLAWASGIAVLLAVIYCGSDFRPEKDFVAWAATLRGPAGATATFLAEHLRVFPNALEGLVRQLKHNVLGHGVYLLGRAHARAVPHYFALALAIKLSPSLLLGTAALAAFRPRALRNEAFAAALALLLLSVTYRVQIGVRLVLPVVSLLVVGVSAGAVRAAQEAGPRARALAVAISGAAVVGAGATSVRVFPDALCYTNPFWGGTDRGYRLLSDSNYDWGQGLPELRRWVERRSLPELDVWYFGTDPAADRPPFRKKVLTGARSLRDVAASLDGDLLAASTTLLYGAYVGVPPPAWVLELRARREVARTRTFLIYDLGPLRAVPAKR